MNLDEYLAAKRKELTAFGMTARKAIFTEHKWNAERTKNEWEWLYNEWREVRRSAAE